MKYCVKSTALTSPVQGLVIGIYEDQQYSKSFAELNQTSQNYLAKLATDGEISGKLGQISLLRNVPNVNAERIFVVGFGKQGELSERQYKQAMQKLWQVLSEANCNEILLNIGEIAIKDRDLYWNIRFAIETFEHSAYKFEEFKSEKSPAIKLQQITFNQSETAIVEQAIAHATAIAKGVKIARDVANMPPNICNPAYLAEQAKNLCQKSTALSLEVIDEETMAKLGMNAYLAVSRGSANPAYLSILHYNNSPDKNAKPIVLVGKGLTFDAGGLSLKPSADMDEMKYDMGGAASVLGTMQALIELNLPLNVIGVLAGCENLPDGDAYRPGDILKTMNGLTVEVLNTDAEGRLVLADSLTYVERFEPQVVVDIATLTGACVVALGQHNSGLISTDESLANDLLQAASQSTDKTWRLPLSEEYQEQLKSPFADLANLGGRWGGAITAGAFLSNFSKKYPWAHLDVAGTAWLQGANKGATGRPVSLLTQFLINQVK